MFAAGDSTLELPVNVKVLHAKIAELTLENDFLETALTKQAKVLGISRGSVYCYPKPISEYDQGLMTRMDCLYMKWPFAGARMFRDLVRQEGFTVGRKGLLNNVMWPFNEPIFWTSRIFKAWKG